MKIGKSTVEKIYISELENLDPISVYFEDFGPRRGQVIIKVHDKSWTAFWGGIGDKTVMEFFCSCDKYYLTKNLMDYRNMTETDVEGTIINFKDRIIEARLGNSIPKEETRCFWDDNVKGSFGLEGCSTEHELATWANDNYEIDGYHIFEEWWEAIATKPTSDCLWLRDRIIPEIQAALTP